MFHGWPARSPHHEDVPVEDWCRLVDLGSWAIERMGPDTVRTWTPIKWHHCRHLVLRELLQWYRQHGRDVAAVHSRMNAVRTDHSAGDSPSSSSWSWSSYTGWFPTVCTALGCVFLQLSVLGQVHLWGDVCRRLVQNQHHPPTPTVHIHNHTPGDRHQDATPPTQPPMINPFENDPIMDQWLALMNEVEQERYGPDPDHPDDPDDNDDNDSLPDSLDSFWAHEFQAQHEYDDQRSESPGSVRSHSQEPTDNDIIES